MSNQKESALCDTQHLTVMFSCNTAWNVYTRKRLLEALVSHDWNVITLAQQDAFADKIQTELRIPFIPLPMKSDSTSIIQDVRLFFRYLNLYRRYRPAAVLHINNKPNIYGTLASNLFGIPSISNITGLGIVSEKSGIMKHLVYALYRMAFASRKAHVFFQNNDDRAFFLDNRLVSQEKTSVIPGSGVDTGRFFPLHTNFNPPEKTVFLYNGRLLISKGICDFIEAARRIKQLYPLCNFTIIGEYDCENPIFLPHNELAQAVDSGIVLYKGTVDNVIPDVSVADCVVLPSRYREGVPRALLEAAAMGKPIIAADSVGTREPVEHEINGYIVQPEDIDSLMNAMIRFIRLSSGEKKKMGNESRRIAVERFADSVVINKYVNTLDTICDNATNKDAE